MSKKAITKFTVWDFVKLTGLASNAPITSLTPEEHAAMETRKRRRDAAELEYESDTVTYLRRGMISILDVIAVKLPEVFTAEILPKLDIKDTLNLAQVNKTYNAAVWSVEGVRSMETKMKTHLVKFGKKGWITELLYWAASYGNVPAVRALLESGVDVDQVLAEDNRTALHIAAIFGQVAVMKALIGAGADVNKTTSGNQTALIFAAMLGQSSCVVELIKAGADVNLASNDGDTPLVLAIKHGYDAIVGMLILAGAGGGKEYGQLIAVAKMCKHENIVKVLEQFRA